MQESTGSPDLPNSGRLIELEYATMDDRKLRSQLRNVSSLELQACFSLHRFRATEVPSCHR